MGKTEWRWISLSGNPRSSERSILLLLKIDERNADLVAQSSQGGLLGHQAEVDCGDIQPRRVRAIEPQLTELLGRQ